MITAPGLVMIALLLGFLTIFVGVRAAFHGEMLAVAVRAKNRTSVFFFQLFCTSAKCKTDLALGGGSPLGRVFGHVLCRQ